MNDQDQSAPSAVDSFNAMIQDEYRRAREIPSDINQHLPLLHEFAQEVERVTEFGVLEGLSTRAFLAAQCRLRSYDLYTSPQVMRLVEAARAAGRDVEYRAADVLKLDMEETDLLFIDTLHTGGQLSQELRLHAPKVRRYMAFHDTDTFGLNDETVGSGAGSGALGSKFNQFLVSLIRPTPTAPRGRFRIITEEYARKRHLRRVRKMPQGGLLPAVLNFLAENGGEWRVKMHRTNNNGFTVLERR